MSIKVEADSPNGVNEVKFNMPNWHVSCRLHDRVAMPFLQRQALLQACLLGARFFVFCLVTPLQSEAMQSSNLPLGAAKYPQMPSQNLKTCWTDARYDMAKCSVELVRCKASVCTLGEDDEGGGGFAYSLRRALYIHMAPCDFEGFSEEL